MNQGYEVVETISGNDIAPADEPLLEEKFASLEGRAVNEVLQTIQENVPLLSHMSALQFREFMIDSTIHRVQKDNVIFHRNDYTNSV